MSWSFFGQFVRNWKTVGAVAPSSPELARLVVEAAEIKSADRILELGTGTGAFTDVIAEAMKPEAHFLGLDLNPVFLDKLHQRHPHMTFQAVPAQECDFEGFLGTGNSFDTIISGLPWTAFPTELQVSILDKVLPWLRPGGKFVTFAYTGLHLLPSGQRFRKLIRQRCVELRTTPTVFKNLPPAFVYSACLAQAEPSCATKSR